MRYLYNDEFKDDIVCKTKDDFKFYENYTFDEASISKILKRPTHSHTNRLGSIIESDMLSYTDELSTKQKENIQKLKDGHKVVIAGQQAGLFLNPSYILHKIISILVVVNDVKKMVDYDAVPVFWVASEDHDYEEINHTHVYDNYHKRVKKVSYKPNLNVEMSIGFYEYDKKDMHNVLNSVFNYTEDKETFVQLKRKIQDEIDRHNTWTELFSALVNSVFKDYGLLIFNAHHEKARQLEVDMFKEMLEHSDKIDDAFRTGQEEFINHFNVSKTIDTDTNVHLFVNSDLKRELLTRDGGDYKTEMSSYTYDELIEMLENNPKVFSNNVVTRPLMQEMLFNTLVFLGGGAEVKYWGELHKVFEVMNVDMPIILKRMSFMNVTEHAEKLLSKYDLNISPRLLEDIEKEKEKIESNATNKKLLKEISNFKNIVVDEMKNLDKASKTKHEANLLTRNEEQMLKQLDYLERKYTYDVRRNVRNELTQLDEIGMLLLPKGVLQERVYHPLVFMTEMWDFSPLSYTDKLIIVMD